MCCTHIKRYIVFWSLWISHLYYLCEYSHGHHAVLSLKPWPKPSLNLNLASKNVLTLLTFSSALLVEMCILVLTMYKNRQGKRVRERTWKSGCDVSSSYSLYIFCIHAHAHKTPCACRPSANYLWCIPTIFLTYIYDDMFLCSMYCMYCMWYTHMQALMCPHFMYQAEGVYSSETLWK